MTWRLGQRPALTGLRGLAILFVLAAHFDNPATNPLTGSGSVGVTLFFTLSGFLITSLLLEESGRSGRVSLRGFYRRRVARLLPASLAVLAFVALVQATWRPLGVQRAMFPAILLNVSNLWQLHTHAPLSGLAQTWSLAIEEQFYLVWPALVILGLRWGRRGVAWIGGGAMAVSIAAVLTSSGMQQQWGSVERASSLLAGCLLAVWMTSRPEPRGSRLAVVGGLAALVPLMFVHEAVSPLLYLLGVPALGVVILWGASGAAPMPWLSIRPLRWFGQRSYGIYLWHYPLLWAIPVSGDYWARTVVVLGLSLGAAELSWRVVEQPVQRLLRRSGDARNAAKELVTHGTLDGSAVRGCNEADMSRGHGLGRVRPALDPGDSVHRVITAPGVGRQEDQSLIPENSSEDTGPRLDHGPTARVAVVGIGPQSVSRR
jgi:peptidoglycan/LPS O-acetylase OafA/YrhL